MPISAKVILKSSSQYATKPLCTFELRYPKFIHGEFMTHRVLSRNASSSRAIPVRRLIDEVRNDATRAAPIHWGANQKGMQAAEELSTLMEMLPANRSGEMHLTSKMILAKDAWAMAALDAATNAERLDALGAHKQIVNRILEPFSHINVVATATEWDNFFGLRLHHMAQPEMQELAKQMWKAYNEAPTQHLEPGQWHLPYVPELNHGDPWNDMLIKQSVARCARVTNKSLVTPHKFSSPEEDLQTYMKLNIPGTETYDPLQPIHASPAEHQATPDYKDVSWEHPDRGWKYKHEWGNFVGWRQYRKMLPGESCAPLPEEYLPF